MIKVLYAVMLCLGAMVIINGCVAENTGAIDEDIIGGGQCGNTVCTGKTFCCNASCSICAPIGGGCTQQVCEATVDDSAHAAPSATSGELVSEPNGPEYGEDDPQFGLQACGPVTCTGNTHCCNASCGICVPPGGVCTQQFCGPVD